MIHITIAGSIGRDAETRDTGADTVTGFSVASSRKIKGEEVTTWIVVNMWGKRGLALAKYLKKGTQVCVVGELSQREYVTKEGERRVSLECRANDVKLMGGKREGGDDAAPAPRKAAPVADDAWAGGDEEIPF
jgi:single-strand DNA-binding protein